MTVPPFSANDVDNEIGPIGTMTKSPALVLYDGNIIAFIRVEGWLQPASQFLFRVINFKSHYVVN